MATGRAVALSLVVASLAGAQSRVTGIVKSKFGDPIPFAHVIQRGENLGAVTDSAGRYELSFDHAGSVELRARRIGFGFADAKVSLIADSVVTRDFVLELTALTLDAVKIVERTVDGLSKTGFYDRLDQRKKGSNSGFFITPEELELRKPVRVSDILAGAPSLQLVNGKTGEARVMNNGRTCLYTVYLDGVRQELLKNGSGSFAFGSKGGGMPLASATDVNALVPGTDVAAVEVYTRTTSAPPQFQMLNGACGIVAIWTKR